jgi:hypothetical protein
MIAPGVTYLVRIALLLGIPTVCAVTVIRQVAATFDIRVPTWVLFFICVAGVPLYTTLRLTTTYLYNRRQAAAFGARLAPTPVNGKWPGNLDLLMEMHKNTRTGYPGTHLF